MCLHIWLQKSLFVFLGVWVFQSLCVLLNEALCETYPLKSLFLHTSLWYTYSVALKLKAFAPCPSFPLLFSFPPSCLFSFTSFMPCLVCYPTHPTNAFLFTFSVSFLFLSGAFVDRVQLPDDDGTSAERKSQCDRGRPIHASRLSAQMEGL